MDYRALDDLVALTYILHKINLVTCALFKGDFPSEYGIKRWPYCLQCFWKYIFVHINAGLNWISRSLFNIYSQIHWFGISLVLWCLMPLSTIFQLYRGSQFYWWRKPEFRRKLPTYRKSLANVVLRTPFLSGISTHNCNGDRHWLHS